MAATNEALLARIKEATVMFGWGKSGGSGVAMISGSGRQYIGTNAHVVWNPNTDTPTGPVIDDQFYYFITDSKGHLGFARLITYNALGICTGKINSPYQDGALLEAITPQHPDFERIWWQMAWKNKIATDSPFAQYITGTPSPRDFSITPFSTTEITRALELRDVTGSYIVHGYPKDKQGQAETATGIFTIVPLVNPPHFAEFPSLNYRILLTGTEKTKLRSGYSGSPIVSEKLGVPIGIASSVDQIAAGILITPMIQVIDEIERQLALGSDITVRASHLESCDVPPASPTAPHQVKAKWMGEVVTLPAGTPVSPNLPPGPKTIPGWIPE